jgi:uncharacterized membrane protein YccC
MSDLHTNGSANRAPTGVQDDIVEQLEWHNTCVRNADGLCLLQQALYKIEHQQAEIERLRTALEVAANHMSMTGAPQATIDAIRKAVRGG